MAGAAEYLIWEEKKREFDNNKKYSDFIYNIGAGFGIEYKLNENIRLNLEWPLCFSFYEDQTRIIMYMPQGGIHYYFK